MRSHCVPHHGNTGIGTDKLPKMKPEIALWAEIKRNGQVISCMSPAHVMFQAANRFQDRA